MAVVGRGVIIQTGSLVLKKTVLRLTGEEIAEIEAKEEAEYYARFMRR